jgi:hypothetical protein
VVDEDKLDVLNCLIAIEWSAFFQDDFRMAPVPLANGTAPNIVFPLDIYRDTQTVLKFPDGRFNSSEGPSGGATYKLMNTSTPSIAVIGLSQEDSFSTDISFRQGARANDILRQPLFAYPYDLVSMPLK